jgi:hypothetical protein
MVPVPVQRSPRRLSTRPQNSTTVEIERPVQYIRKQLTSAHIQP